MKDQYVSFLNERIYMNLMPIKVIVFDLVGVLFCVNKIKALQSLSYKDLIFYYLRKGKNPIDEGIMLLDKMRLEVPGQFQDIVAYKGNYLPNCFLQWNKGVISNHEAFTQIKDYFDILDQRHYFTSQRHKRVILNLLRTLFSAQLGITSFLPIASTVNLVEKLKQTKNYRLYVLSNIDSETFAGIKVLHESVFNLFDGIVTSCDSHFIKPDSAIFEYLFKNYDLDPLVCCFVDDQIENLVAAERLGMRTILCTKPSLLPEIFKKKNLL